MVDRALVPAPGVLAEGPPEAIVLVTPDGSRVLRLNATGSHVWTLVDGERSLPEVVSAFRARHPRVPAEDVERDVRTYLSVLSAHGLLEGVVEQGR